MSKLITVVSVLIIAVSSAYAGSNILPSGDMTGVTDQAAIAAALETTDAKVTLAEGTFYVNGGIKTTGFYGTLRGAGKSETQIVALGEGDRENNRGSVLLFESGSPTIMDLTINVPVGSKYVDSNPNLGTSDGGAAIDILNGSATIKNVGILSNGPFLEFGPESLETGILVHNGNGKFELKQSTFQGNKRAFIFNPEEASHLDLTLIGNEFANNRSGISLTASDGGNDGQAMIQDNVFTDNLVYDIVGFLIEYPVNVQDNAIRHGEFDGAPVGNSAIEISGSGPLKIASNHSDGQYVLPNIFVRNHTGGAVIVGNTVSGTSSSRAGAIGAEACSDISIKKNKIIPDASVSIPSELGLTIVDCQNASIKDNEISFPEGLPNPIHIFLDEMTRHSEVRGKGIETVLDQAEFDEDIVVNDRVLDVFDTEGQKIFELTAVPKTAIPGDDPLDFVVVLLPDGSVDQRPYTFDSSPPTVTLSSPLQASEQLFIQYETTDVIFNYAGCGEASGSGVAFDRSPENTETEVIEYSSPFAGSVAVEVLLECIEVDKNNDIRNVRNIIGAN